MISNERTRCNDHKLKIQKVSFEHETKNFPCEDCQTLEQVALTGSEASIFENIQNPTIQCIVQLAVIEPALSRPYGLRKSLEVPCNLYYSTNT